MTRDPYFLCDPDPDHYCVSCLPCLSLPQPASACLSLPQPASACLSLPQPVLNPPACPESPQPALNLPACPECPDPVLASDASYFYRLFM